LFYTNEKIINRINEIESYRYREKQEIEYFNTFVPQYGEETQLPKQYDNHFISKNDSWSGRDHYMWISKVIAIPDTMIGRKLVVYLDLGRTGGGNNSGFEAMLYVNGRPFQGVDSNHKEVILPSDIQANVRIDVLLWSGLEGGGHPREQFYRLNEAWFGWLDETVDQFYFLSQSIMESLLLLDENNSNKVTLTSLLDDTYRLIDWTIPGENVFYNTINKANHFLESELAKLQKNNSVTIHTIGHSHIDLAWLWRIKHTKEKAKRTFSTVLRLMELYPDFKFIQSQPQLYEWIKVEDPELYEKICGKVANGQWEVEGAMWVEADCNIPSGESLVRQILYGKEFFKKEFNIDSRILWLPDVFGYSWALPQILKKADIDTFMTTKISWNQYNRIPHDTFKWKGIDGTEILTHFVTTPEPGRDKDSWFYTYNGLITAETLTGIWDKYQDKSINNQLLLAYGYGDGGGGVNREMIELNKQFNKVPTMPTIKSSNARRYFDNLNSQVDQSKGYVHTWDGELYLEYHRGTYTSQAKMKKRNRKLEFDYRLLEMMSVKVGLEYGWDNYPEKQLSQGWKKILLNQFHDIIPGSSIKEVYEDAHRDYDEADEIFAMTLLTQKNLLLEMSNKKWSVFNPLQFDGPNLVKIPISGKGYTQNGELLMSQVVRGEETLVLAHDLKPMAFTNLELVDQEYQGASLSEINLADKVCETPHHIIKWDDAGHIIQLFDKHENRELIDRSSGSGNKMVLFEDKPLAHDAWDIDIFYQEKSQIISNITEFQVLDNGPLRSSVLIKWEHPLVDIEQKMHMYYHTNRIDFETNVQWRGKQHLLKVEFPFDFRTTEAIYDIQFGNVKRPTHWNTSWDLARFESVGHKWCALSEMDYGVAILNDSKYGHSVKSNVMSLSLLKGAIHPDPTADIGNHHFTYSVFSFKGELAKRSVEKEALFLNQPLKADEGEVSQSSDRGIIRSSNDHIMIDAIKKSEKGMNVIVRLHEMEGIRGEAQITSEYIIHSWREVNLLENAEVKGGNTGSIKLQFIPYEIKTIEVYLEK